MFGYDRDCSDWRGRIGGDTITVTRWRRPRLAARGLRRHVAGRRLVQRHSSDVLGYEFGEKPFDPFTQPARRRERGRRVGLPAGRPVPGRQRRHRRQRAVRRHCRHGALPSVGFTAYGGGGNDLIIGSQAGDHLAGGSGDDEIHGDRGVDHIYGDSGVNVDILTRAPDDQHHATPARGRRSIPNQSQQRHDDRAHASPVADPLDAGRDVIYGDGPGTVAGGPESAYDDVIFGDHGAVIQNVVDPNLPDAAPAEDPDDDARRRSGGSSRGHYQNGNDDVIFGNLGRDIIIGGAGHDMADGDEADDLVFGDNVVRLLRRINETNAGDRHHQPALPDAGRNAALQPHRPRSAGYATPNADTSGQLLLQLMAARRSRELPRPGRRAVVGRVRGDYASAAHLRLRRRGSPASAASATTTWPAARPTT